MTERRIILFLFSALIIFQSGFSQKKETSDGGILFHGMVMDAANLSPVRNTQIMINSSFSAVSSDDGSFAFYVNHGDTVVFNSLGYKSEFMHISDTLTGMEFIAGIYLNSDTLSIGEVIIVPRLTNLKSDLMNGRSKTPETFNNARYNVAMSAYHGRTGINNFGDASGNYSILSQKQKNDAFERGGIPSDKIAGLSPLLLIPAAFLLIKGVPEKPAQFKSELTDQDLNQIQKKYFETLRQRK
jgi:hypothetical protein